MMIRWRRIGRYLPSLALAHAGGHAIYRFGGGSFLADYLIVLALLIVQNALLLYPLRRMARLITSLRAQSVVTERPRLAWSGRDEFATLADAVNGLLGAVSSRAAEMVDEVTSRQTNLLNSLPDTLLAFDAGGRLVSVLKVFEEGPPMPGLAVGEQPSRAVFGVEDVDAFVAAIGRTMGDDRVDLVRFKVQRPYGVPRETPTRHYELRTMRLGRDLALVIVRDTTDLVAEIKRRRTEDARADDAKRRASLSVFAATLAHDMNNVLSVILHAVEAEGADPSGDSAEAHRAIREAVRRGAGMMRELGFFAGECRIRLVRMSAREVFEDVRIMVAESLTPNISLACEDSGEAPDVGVDPNQIWKVFFNLARNAVEAIGPDRPGHLVLGCRRFEMTEAIAPTFSSDAPLPAGTGTLFLVRDDGPGLPAGLLPRLYDPYVSSKASGRGLGLATVRTIVGAHGGGIAVESKANVGTVFRIFLPATDLPVAEDGAQTGSALSERNEILVVDDQELILKTAAILLKAMKLVPFVARDQAGALAVARSHGQTLRAILLDVQLVGATTVRLIESLRVVAPGVPVIVSTGGSEENARQLFADHPYDGFLAKPYTADELRKALALAPPPPPCGENAECGMICRKE